MSARTMPGSIRVDVIAEGPERRSPTLFIAGTGQDVLGKGGRSGGSMISDQRKNPGPRPIHESSRHLDAGTVDAPRPLRIFDSDSPEQEAHSALGEHAQQRQPRRPRGLGTGLGAW